MPIKNTKAFSLSQNTENSLDPIRENIQSYWIYDGTELVYDKNNAYNSEEKSAQTNFNFNFTKQTFRKESIVFDADTEIETTKFIETLEKNGLTNILRTQLFPCLDPLGQITSLIWMPQ
jgi:hypothetical protein